MTKTIIRPSNPLHRKPETIITYSDMNTPSKEALEAAFDLFKHRYCYGSDNDNAAIIDRHFSPLRQRAEQAEARNAELEDALRGMIKNAERDGDTRLAVQRALAALARAETARKEVQP